MYAFETFVYLDVQKTGSRFIVKLLEDFSKEKLVEAKEHGRISRVEKNKYYFITCRDPLDQLLSLYFFGCGGVGQIYHRLSALGHADFYDRTQAGFERWLGFLQDPDNAPALGEDYAESGIASLCGFMTFRFVVLSMARPITRLARCCSRRDLVRLYERRNVASAVLRFERLTASAKELVDGPLRHRLRNPDDALVWIDQTGPLNASKRGDRETTFSISATAKRLVEEREWFLFEVLGYPEYGKGGRKRLPDRPRDIRRRRRFRA